VDSISKDISKAVEILNQNGLVAIPTETVYGLAGNIFSEEAIRKIFELKQRPFFNPLIVHIHSANQLKSIVTVLPQKAEKLAQHFWPGPLTLVLPKNPHVPDLVTAGKNTVAVRVPNHPTTLDLLRRLDFPIAAPSANPFGRISTTKAEHVARYFDDRLKMVLDGGECQKGIESTIIGFENDRPVVYRLGSISVEEIEKVVGPLNIRNKKESAPDAPGMLSRHYAPKTKTVLVDDLGTAIQKYSNLKIGLLTFDKDINNDSVLHQIILSLDSDMDMAMAKLYAAMHHLDSLDLEIIIAEKFPDHGLGRSINDRLSRATKS
jgi:L-threonylcarbamoyladenylate synthase